jgi:hypothetical protein
MINIMATCEMSELNKDSFHLFNEVAAASDQLMLIPIEINYS